MSEQVQATQLDPVGDEPTDVKDSAQGDSGEEVLGDAGKKALIKEREARKQAERQAAAFKKQLDDAAKANMSDLERAQADAEAAQERAAAAERDVQRYRIAAKHGISDADADLFLTGADEAAMTAQAERYAELNKTPATPRPDPSQGAKDEPKSTSPAQSFAAAFKGRI